MEYYMRDVTKRTFRDIDLQIVPDLPLPSRVETPGANAGYQGPKEDKIAKEDDLAIPAWWKSNPETVDKWKLPQDKWVGDFFNPAATQGKDNIARFPLIPHHTGKGKPRRPCIRYLLGLKCKGEAKCTMAHVKPSTLGQEKRKEVDEAFRIAYSAS